MTRPVCGLAVGLTGLLPQAHLDPATLFTLMLPPLLFAAAIQLHAGALRRDARSIATFVVAGRLIVTGVVGLLGHYALGLPLATALVFRGADRADRPDLGDRGAQAAWRRPPAGDGG